MKIKHLWRLVLLALLAAWIFDLLFWERSVGVSYALMVLVLLVVGLGLAWGEGAKPAWGSLAVLLPVIFFAAMSMLRSEPVTQFVNYGMSLGMMAVLAATLAGGGWLRYTFIDHVVNQAILWVKTVAGLGMVVGKQALVTPMDKQGIRHADAESAGKLGNKETSDEEKLSVLSSSTVQSKANKFSVAAGWLRGLLLAAPLLLVFGALLAQADAAFAQSLDDLWALFRIENLPEYIFRMFYVIVLGYVLAGIYLYAIAESRQERISTDAQQRFPILPFTEASVVLGSVNLLFLAFVLVQFLYFFGGQANINVAGYTYAEYARRGFNELVIVAFGSLLLFIGMSKVTRRTGATHQRIFTGLGAGLALLVAIMLVSAFMRLRLYEAVYGFTRLRLYTHIFMIWLGGLLVVLIALELLGKTRYFALACLAAALGFGATLNILSVDGFIVKANVGRAGQGQALDAAYLATLSPEAIPVLVGAFENERLDAAVHHQLGAALACQATRSVYQPAASWPEFHLGQYWAAQLLEKLQGELTAYPLFYTDRAEAIVSVNGVLQPCFSDDYYWMGD